MKTYEIRVVRFTDHSQVFGTKRVQAQTWAEAFDKLDAWIDSIEAKHPGIVMDQDFSIVNV